ncbi:integrase core domain-containing protein [Ktedonobacter racemifer]|uniref:integrase core domain-containing protein n=1 Tax=Ktedonobacter racemifer TaxID=363277 RepID=UPI003B75BF6F
MWGGADPPSALAKRLCPLDEPRWDANGQWRYAERFVGTFKLAVADRYRYHSLGAFLQTAQTWVNFYNQHRPHEGLGNLSPQQFAQQQALEIIPSITFV